MILDLGDLNITKEEMRQAAEIKRAIDRAVADTSPELGFEHVILWWLASEPADA